VADETELLRRVCDHQKCTVPRPIDLNIGRYENVRLSVTRRTLEIDAPY